MRIIATLTAALVLFFGCTEEKPQTEISEDQPQDKEVTPQLTSNLEILDVITGERKVVYATEGHFEAPNWSRDGSELIFNSDGKLYKIPVEGGEPKLINTDFATQCNNDHVLSPDGKYIAISHHEDSTRQSKIYILPYEGGTPWLITPKGPSYLHGWSPDGSTLTYCAERNGEYDVYVIDTAGGEEIQLTDAEGLDDGPEYGPEGAYIYFNSVRTGTMQIWRMKPDGSEQTQLTFDNNHDWFPHVSPDGKQIIFVSYDKTVEGHPPNKDVTLRMMPAEGDEPKVVAELFGGQGTINVHSWSPDSKKVAFVSYELKE